MRIGFRVGNILCNNDCPIAWLKDNIKIFVEIRMINFKRLALVIAFLLLIAGFVVAGTWLTRVYSDVKQLRALVDEVRELQSQGIQIENIPTAIGLAERISFVIDDLKKEMEPILPLIRKLENMAGIGPYLQMVEPGLDYASNLSKAAVVLGQTFVQLMQESALDSPRSPSERLSNFLLDNQLNFKIAEKLLLEAAAGRERIDSQLIPEKYRDDLLSIDVYVSKSSLLFHGLRVAPHLLGAEEAITYLLLVQNKDELRASGGFITAFGLMRLKDRRILTLKIDDSTSDRYDYVREVREPPYPLGEIMFAGYLVARDANWSPDFPTAAVQTQEMYYLSTEIDTDGVVAFDQQLIVDLLELTGPLDLPDEDIPIDAGNVEEKMIEYKQAAVDERNSEERKEFLSIIAPHLIRNILKISDPKEIIDLGKLLLKAIQRGHLLMYFNDPEVQDLLYQMELDGAVRPGEDDFLMMVDSNLGFSKVDQYIDRSLAYIVDLGDPANPHAEIQLMYEHTNSGSEPCLQGTSTDSENLEINTYGFSRCYWNYWRVLTVNGTSLKNAFFTSVPKEYFRFDEMEWKNEVDTGPGEGGTYVLGGLTVVPQLQVQEVILETSLPASVIKEDSEARLIYTLRIQKQPGIISLPVELQVTAPSGFTLLELPDGWVITPEQNKYIWEGEVRKTTDFQLEFIKV